MKLHPEVLVKHGKKPFVVLPYEEFVALQERLDDAEDLLELCKAKRAEGKKAAIGLANVKRKLGLRCLCSRKAEKGASTFLGQEAAARQRTIYARS